MSTLFPLNKCPIFDKTWPVPLLLFFLKIWMYKWPRYCRGPAVKGNKQPNLAVAQKLIWQTLGAEKGIGSMSGYVVPIMSWSAQQ